MPVILTDAGEIDLWLSAEATADACKYPPAKPGALGFEPLKAAWGPLTRPYP